MSVGQLHVTGGVVVRVSPDVLQRRSRRTANLNTDVCGKNPADAAQRLFCAAWRILSACLGVETRCERTSCACFALSQVKDEAFAVEEEDDGGDDDGDGGSAQRPASVEASSLRPAAPHLHAASSSCPRPTRKDDRGVDRKHGRDLHPAGTPAGPVPARRRPWRPRLLRAGGHQHLGSAFRDPAQDSGPVPGDAPREPEEEDALLRSLTKRILLWPESPEFRRHLVLLPVRWKAKKAGQRAAGYVLRGDKVLRTWRGGHGEVSRGRRIYPRRGAAPPGEGVPAADLAPLWAPGELGAGPGDRHRLRHGYSYFNSHILFGDFTRTEGGSQPADADRGEHHDVLQTERPHRPFLRGGDALHHLVFLWVDSPVFRLSQQGSVL